MKWNLDLLRDIFHGNDVQRISKIYVNYSGAEDTWIWMDEEKGVYTVKSGYRRLSQSYNFPSNSVPDFNWLKIRNLSVPSKMKKFIWRTFQICLPSLYNLIRKHVEVYLICLVCNSTLESSKHVQLLSRMLKDVGSLVR